MKLKRPQPWAPHGKLTPENVAEIRRSKLGLDDLARKYGVHRRTIFRTIIFESWKSIG
jgi:hypothetical protein